MRNLLKKISKEFVFGSHMTSLEASAMVYSVMVLRSIPVDPVLLAIPYLSAQVIYSYNHFREVGFDESSNPERAILFKSNINTKRYMFTVFSLILLVLLTFTNRNVSISVIIIVLGGFLYTDLFKSIKITGLKNFYVSFFWVLMLLIVPLNLGLPIEKFYLLILFIYFLSVLANTIFFDVKDINSDRERGIKTFPVVLGLKRSMHFTFFIKLLGLVVTLLGTYYEILPKIFLLYIIVVLYGIVYINSAYYLKSAKLRLISYLVADAEFILWAMILATAQIFFY